MLRTLQSTTDRGNAFEFKPFERTNEIEVHYQNAPSDGGSHSAGIENDAGSVGISFLLGNGSLTGRAVRYSPNRRIAIPGYGDGVLPSSTSVFTVDSPLSGPLLDVDVKLALAKTPFNSNDDVDSHHVTLQHGATSTLVFNGQGKPNLVDLAVVLDDEAVLPVPHDLARVQGRFKPSPERDLSIFEASSASGSFSLEIDGAQFQPPGSAGVFFIEWAPRLLVDATGDTDGDGVIDQRDTCPLTRDPVHGDLDGDGEGDLCDITPAGTGNQSSQTSDPPNYRCAGSGPALCDQNQGQPSNYACDYKAPPDIPAGPGVCRMRNIDNFGFVIGYSFPSGSTPPPSGAECCALESYCDPNGCYRPPECTQIEDGCTEESTDPCCFSSGSKLFRWGQPQGFGASCLLEPDAVLGLAAGSLRAAGLARRSRRGRR